MSAILPMEAPMSIIAFVIAAFITAVSNRYLWGRPLPRLSGSCGLALDNN